MLTTLGEMFKSKKALAMFAAILVAILAAVMKKLDAPLDTATVIEIQGALGFYIIGQGIADHGKESAKLRPPGPSSVAIAVVPEPPANATPPPTP